MEHWRLTMQKLVASYTPREQCFCPTPESWSMLQVMKHLIIAETGILHAIKKNLQRPQLHDNGWLQKVTYLLTQTVLRLPVKIKAPVKALMPETETNYEQLVAEWELLRAQWRNMLEDFPPELTDKNIFRHPIAGFFNIFQAIDFCSYHIKHHLQQIDRIAQALKRQTH